MGKIILARHGESEDNSLGILGGSRDTGLTSNGVIHAYQLASFIQASSTLNIQQIISSTLKRARKTAEICAQELARSQGRKVKVRGMKILAERHFGVAEGCLITEIPLKARSFRQINGLENMIYVEEADEAEELENFYKRAGLALKRLKNKALEEGDTLVVGHAGICQMMYLHHHKRRHEDIFLLPFMQNGQWYVIE